MILLVMCIGTKGDERTAMKTVAAQAVPHVGETVCFGDDLERAFIVSEVWHYLDNEEGIPEIHVNFREVTNGYFDYLVAKAVGKSTDLGNAP